MQTHGRAGSSSQPSLGDQLIETLRDFNGSNVLDVAKLTFLMEQMTPLLQKANINYYNHIQKIQKQVKLFFVKKYEILARFKFRSNSFNITDDDYSINKDDLKKRIQWKNQMEEGHKKYGFEPLPINNFGVIVHREHEKLIDAYVPINTDLDKLTHLEIKNIRNLYLDYHKKTLALTEHVMSLLDVVFMFWVCCRVCMIRLMTLKKTIQPYVSFTLNDLFGWFGDIHAITDSLLINRDQFYSMQVYRLTPILMIYAVDNISDNMRHKLITEMDLKTAVKVTQIFRTCYWFYPFHSARMRDVFEAYCNRVAELLVDAHEAEVLNVDDLTMQVKQINLNKRQPSDASSSSSFVPKNAPADTDASHNRPKKKKTHAQKTIEILKKLQQKRMEGSGSGTSDDDEEEDEDDDDVEEIERNSPEEWIDPSFVFETEKQGNALPQLHTYRIFHAFIRGMLTQIIFRSHFDKQVALKPNEPTDKYDPSAIRLFLEFTSLGLTLSETEKRRMIENLSAMYMGPGSKFIFTTLHPFLQADPMIIVPITLGGRVFSGIMEQFTMRSLFELITHPKLAGHLKMVIALHILENCFLLLGIKNFMRKYVLWPHQMIEIQTLYFSCDNHYPRIVVITNEFAVLHKNTIYTAQNDPNTLLGFFFWLIAEHCECYIENIPIFDALKKMGIKSEKIKYEFMNGKDYREILFTMPPDLIHVNEDL